MFLSHVEKGGRKAALFLCWPVSCEGGLPQGNSLLTMCWRITFGQAAFWPPTSWPPTSWLATFCLANGGLRRRAVCAHLRASVRQGDIGDLADRQGNRCSGLHRPSRVQHFPGQLRSRTPARVTAQLGRSDGAHRQNRVVRRRMPETSNQRPGQNSR